MQRLAAAHSSVFCPSEAGTARGELPRRVMAYSLKHLLLLEVFPSLRAEAHSAHLAEGAGTAVRGRKAPGAALKPTSWNVMDLNVSFLKL